MGIDDLIRQMQADEEADRIELQTKATPIEYARLHGMAPQRVYYFLRNHSTRNGVQLAAEQCVCGRKVIDMKLADTFFGFAPEEPDEEELTEEDLDENDFEEEADE